MMRTNYRIAHMIEHFLVFRTHVLLNEGEHTQRENGRLGEISSRFAHRHIVGRRFFCTLLRCRQKISSEFVEKNSLDVPPGWGGVGGAYSLFVACLSHLTIDHAPLSSRSTVCIPNRDTSNVCALITIFPCRMHKNCLLILSSSCFAVYGRGCPQFVHGRSRMATDPRIQCRDGARRVFTNQTGIACTKREVP